VPNYFRHAGYFCATACALADAGTSKALRKLALKGKDGDQSIAERCSLARQR
jgi:hypothetical protein